MILNGGNGNPQVASDLFVGKAPGDTQGDLILPGSQARKAFWRSWRSPGSWHRSDTRHCLGNDDRGANPSAGPKIEFNMKPFSAKICKERQSLPSPCFDIAARQLQHSLFYRFRRLVIQHVTNGVCK